MSIDYNERIPNNVHLSDDRRLQRALDVLRQIARGAPDQFQQCLGPEIGHGVALT